MVEWSVDAVRACASVRAIVVAAPAGHVHDFGGHDVGVVAGGETRAQSVANALAAVGTELVAIHDAARPLLTPELFEGVVTTLAADPDADAAIAAIPVTDTIKRTLAASSRFRGSKPTGRVENEPRTVGETLSRDELWAAQTPQVFRTAALRTALDVGGEARPSVTDEAMLVEAAGGTVLIHPATPENLKVTTPLDLRLAELLLAERGSIPQ
jgi:2-C-methyl-D-erythritol 4-phosphate cytidylyltransferase